MKVSVQWLREWVDVGDDVDALSHSLTMAGLEVEGNHPAAVAALTGILVAEITAVERHPNAEKLSVCRVNSGKEMLQIVCGASNVRAGMKAPLAQVGASLPNGMTIRKAKLRGVDSQGMLCSARELGLGDDVDGLLDLPSNTAVGTDITQALSLDDRVLEINLTPNRGDCMSVAGVARETAAVTGNMLHALQIEPVPAKSNDTIPIKVESSKACPRFVGRVIRDVRPNQTSPFWMRERLRRAGVRSISLLVDVTNYVVLELGQPMHAYDLSRLNGGITVRMAVSGEKLTLLDGRAIELAPDILVIADSQSVVGMAGIMGGAASGIDTTTTDVFLEAAYFAPDAIAGRGRRFGLVTDASQRFERGVDPELSKRAVERATQLILDYAGGTPGPTTTTDSAFKQVAVPIRLRHERVNRVLGVKIDAASITRHLVKLGMDIQPRQENWEVTPPSWRFDIAIEEDLIEEIGRLHGYDNIPAVDTLVSEQLGSDTESVVHSDRLADLLCDRGYQEVITHSFVDPEWQRLMFPGESARALVNPISADLGVMRLSLWPGLAQAARENVRRQQARVRLFEFGHKFIGNEEVEVVGGLALGAALPEQWDASNRKIDFFDVKADLEAILAATGDLTAFSFKSERHSALHPGQTARIYRGTKTIGWLGALHPEVAKQMDLTYGVYVFELDVLAGLAAHPPEFVEISRYPAVRRDIAAVVDEAINFDQLGAAVRAAAGLLLRDLTVLSVYRGTPIDKGKKSIALGLNLQDTSRTLTDEDADRVVTQVILSLRDRVGGSIRDK